ncbi:MAG: tRNA (N6-threonylcarbamoyladenosine(37)-N6)-methyltransferase TrmO [Deltaproteobacteria bacterium]|nr:MAG: tRNA (N6-threonylcarbamoyladenosine(37)-N6)-methyltransferase TrmO [Deltaproteobacteria bacterium]PIE73310.1 MAG: tRNA (N6-threonylcarbamoyladenosine(37)-N6)-methyltransferase TrmO [Deltaproteobacteria bacterium]
MQKTIFEIEAIGVVHSCFQEKFGIPRQPGMVSVATAELELFPPFNRQEILRGIEKASHLWLQFIFHGCIEDGWKPTVRPPWLGGHRRFGVFATRSPHRPNHLGLSVVRLEGILFSEKGCRLKLSGVDIMDGTPVVDIKPYLAYSDSIEEATCGLGTVSSPECTVDLSAEVEQFCQDYQQDSGRPLRQLIREVIAQDPRPPSQKGTDKHDFGLTLWDVNVRFRRVIDGFLVVSCTRVR